MGSNPSASTKGLNGVRDFALFVEVVRVPHEVPKARIALRRTGERAVRFFFFAGQLPRMCRPKTTENAR